MYFFARLRIDLQIGIFGIIAQDSDFPEIALQNCKSDMTTPLKDRNKKVTFVNPLAIFRQKSDFRLFQVVIFKWLFHFLQGLTNTFSAILIF